MKRIEKGRNPYNEIGDLVIDRLLLRYLLYHVNSIRPAIWFSLTW